MGRRPFVNDAGRAQNQRRVHNIAVAGNPAGVSGAPPAILFFDVKGPRQGRRGIDLIAAMRVQNAFGLAGRAAGVQDEKRIFGIHDFSFGARAGHWQRHQLVIPVIAARLHRDVVASALDHNHRIDHRRTANSFIDRVFELDDFAAQPGAIAGNQDAALGVFDAVGQGLFGKTAIDDAVRRADFGAGQHGNRNFRHAPHINRHAVALLQTHAAQYVGELVDFLPQLPIGQRNPVAIFTFPDESQLVAPPGMNMAVKRVERHISLAADKPLIKRLAAVVEDLIPFFVPVQGLGALRPESLRVGQRFIINRFIIGYIRLIHHLGRRVMPFADWRVKALFRHGKLLFVNRFKFIK